jgi:hypothetical protein
MKFSGKIESSKLGCNTCVEGKFVNSRSRIPDARSQKSLENVDLAGPVSPVSREGFKYCIAFTDDFSGAVFVYFLKCKSDTLKKVSSKYQIYIVFSCLEMQLYLVLHANSG